jgi:acyl-CoA thioesterase
MPPLTPATIESGNAIPLLKTLGITVSEIGERHAEMTVTVDARHLNYFGSAHGGLLATLADTVCFFPRPFLPSGTRVTTVNLNLNYLRAVPVGTMLVARSEVLHLGRSTASLRITLKEAGEGHIVAHGTATLMLLGQ